MSEQEYDAETGQRQAEADAEYQRKELREALAKIVPIVFDIARDFEETWDATDWGQLNEKQKSYAIDWALREYDRAR